MVRGSILFEIFHWERGWGYHTQMTPSSHPMRRRVHGIEGGWEAKCIIKATHTLVLTGTLPRAVGRLHILLPPSVVADWRRHRFLNAAKAIGNVRWNRDVEQRNVGLTPFGVHSIIEGRVSCVLYFFTCLISHCMHASLLVVGLA